MRKVLSVLMLVAVLVAAALPALSITGTVLDKRGKPVPNAQVELSRPNGEVQAVTTDAKGAFSYSPPNGKDAKCSIAVTAPRYAYFPASGAYTLLQTEPVKLVLWPEKKLKGKVIDENGKPVAGAKVALESINASSRDGYHLYLSGEQWKQGQDWSEGVIQEVTTGPDGVFTLDHTPDPSGLDYIYGTLEVTADGRALITQSLEEEHLRGSLVITDPLECKLQGTIYAPDKSGPVTGGVRLSIPGSGGRSSDGRSVSVGKDGEYSFTKLPPGSFTMILADAFEQDYETKQPTGAKESWVLPAVPLDLVAGKTQTLDVNLIEGVLIKGKVVDNATGKDIKKAELFVCHAGKPEGTAHEFLTSHRGFKDGEFSCYVAPGEVDISPQSVGEGEQQAHFYNENQPHLTFTVAASEPKTGLVFKIDPAAGMRYGVASVPKPTPADLELTAGTYALEWDPDLDCGYSVRGKSCTGNDAKSRILKLPKLASSKPLFYAVQLDGPSDDGLLVYAVDESHGTGTGYDTIYVDLDRNRSLADDKPIRVNKPTGRAMQRSPWVEVPSHQGPVKGVHLDKPMKIGFSASSYQGMVYVNLTRKGGWRGKIDTNKGWIDCIAPDTNANGVYGDRRIVGDDLTLAVGSGGDYFYADINLSGRVSMQSAMDMPHLLWLQEATMVAGKLYSMRVSPTGDKITIANYTGRTGKLVASAEKMKSLEASITSVCLTGKSGYHALSHYDGKPIDLPAGKYSVYRCTVSLKQTTGKQMELDCQPNLTVNVKAGQQAKAQLGGKFVMRGIEPDKKAVYLNAGNTSTAGWFMNLGDNITVARIEGTGDYNSYYADWKLSDKSGRVVGASKARYT